ncbi:MAG: aldolase/citrate lyase family protein [Nanoarchaeota archaeon]
MDLKENDLVMCSVKSIEGTTVFVEIEGNGQGNIAMSEVAAGRIRNLREHISINKKIVCKVLKMLNGNIQLSLRRVTAKEREEIEERYQKERTALSLLKTVSKNPEKIIEKIKENEKLWSFFDKARENPSLLEKVMNKEEAQNLAKIFSEKKESEKKAKKIVILRSTSEAGINEIKHVLDIPQIDIAYLGSSQFAISAKAKDFKEANAKVSAAIEQIEKRAKEKKIFFEAKEK